ncbi:MAG: class I SAM-dependent methyltransferase [Phycisphaerales bacterium]|nr:class I SAM-dependent methyltransferase [Phycisphaerales bacterium]MCI0631679.1 class I SAM-dependent methyltransferase [Phycisphaerales bacterium]MCI0677023.1 class I SAM-dependent methyltransferase [Phycisphaerales bacterium]
MAAKAQRPRSSANRKKPGKRKSRARWRTAATSDKYELYELSVQEPQAEGDLVEQVWKDRALRHKNPPNPRLAGGLLPGARRWRTPTARSTPHHIREDFCGTAIVCIDWIKRHRKNTAIGIDLDPKILELATKRSNQKLKPAQRRRLKLIHGDVRTIKTKPVDSVLAMNFSYFIFKTRDQLRRYFRAVRRALVKDGMFLLDAYGGSESYSEIEEDRNFDGFTYIWDQNVVNPITGQVINHIHFEFPDGTKIKKAFTYDWRLWTLPELQEVLREAGFKNVTVYWEGTDKKTGEGDGIWKPSTRGEACAGWIAYLVAEK